MASITENALTILRVLEELGATSIHYARGASQILTKSKLTGIEFKEAKDYLRKQGSIKYSLAPDSPMFLTPEGINHLHSTEGDQPSARIDRTIDASGDIVGREQTTTFDPRLLLEEIFHHIDSSAHPEQDREDLKGEAQEIVQEAGNGDQANETLIGRRLRNIHRIAPDIFDAVVAALANPTAGVGAAVKKIAEKAKAEAGKTAP